MPATALGGGPDCRQDAREQTDGRPHQEDSTRRHALLPQEPGGAKGLRKVGDEDRDEERPGDGALVRHETWAALE